MSRRPSTSFVRTILGCVTLLLGATCAQAETFTVTTDAGSQAYEPNQVTPVVSFPQGSRGTFTIVRTGNSELERLVYFTLGEADPTEPIAQFARDADGDGIADATWTAATNNGGSDYTLVIDPTTLSDDIQAGDLVLPTQHDGNIQTGGMLGDADMPYIRFRPGVTSIKIQVIPLWDTLANVAPERRIAELGEYARFRLSERGPGGDADPVFYEVGGQNTASVRIMDAQTKARVLVQIDTARRPVGAVDGSRPIQPAIVRVHFDKDQTDQPFSAYKAIFFDLRVAADSRNGLRPAVLGQDYDLFYKIGGSRYGEGPEEYPEQNEVAELPVIPIFRPHDEEYSGFGQLGVSSDDYLVYAAYPHTCRFIGGKITELSLSSFFPGTIEDNTLSFVTVRSGPTSTDISESQLLVSRAEFSTLILSPNWFPEITEENNLQSTSATISWVQKSGTALNGVLPSTATLSRSAGLNSFWITNLAGPVTLTPVDLSAFDQYQVITTIGTATTATLVDGDTAFTTPVGASSVTVASFGNFSVAGFVTQFGSLVQITMPVILNESIPVSAENFRQVGIDHFVISGGIPRTTQGYVSGSARWNGIEITSGQFDPGNVHVMILRSPYTNSLGPIDVANFTIDYQTRDAQGKITDQQVKPQVKVPTHLYPRASTTITYAGRKSFSFGDVIAIDGRRYMVCGFNEPSNWLAAQNNPEAGTFFNSFGVPTSWEASFLPNPNHPSGNYSSAITRSPYIRVWPLLPNGDLDVLRIKPVPQGSIPPRSIVDGTEAGNPGLEDGFNAGAQIRSSFQILPSNVSNGRTAIVVPRVPYLEGFDVDPRLSYTQGSLTDSYHEVTLSGARLPAGATSITRAGGTTAYGSATPSQVGFDMPAGHYVEFAVVPRSSIGAEGGKYLSLEIMPDGTNNGFQVVQPGAATVFLSDNDLLASVQTLNQASEAPVDAGTGVTGQTIGRFRVQLTRPATNDILVFYKLASYSLSATPLVGFPEAAWPQPAGSLTVPDFYLPEVRSVVTNDGLTWTEGYNPATNEGTVLVRSGSNFVDIPVRPNEDTLAEHPNDRKYFRVQLIDNPSYLVRRGATGGSLDLSTAAMFVADPRGMVSITQQVNKVIKPGSAGPGVASMAAFPITLGYRSGQPGTIAGGSVTVPMTILNNDDPLTAKLGSDFDLYFTTTLPAAPSDLSPGSQLTGPAFDVRLVPGSVTATQATGYLVLVAKNASPAPRVRAQITLSEGIDLGANAVVRQDSAYRLDATRRQVSVDIEFNIAQIAPGSITLAEGASAVVTVSTANPVAADTRMRLSKQAITGVDADLTLSGVFTDGIGQYVTIPANGTSATFSVVAGVDDANGPKEFAINLSLTGADGYTIDSIGNSTRIHIIDGTVTVGTGSVVYEGSSATVVVTPAGFGGSSTRSVFFTRDASSTAVQTTDYSLSDASGNPLAETAPGVFRLDILPGAASAGFRVSSPFDGNTDLEKTLRFVVTSGLGAVVPTNTSVTFTLRDNQAIVLDRTVIVSAPGSASIRIGLKGAIAQSTLMSFTVGGGTGVAGIHYTSPAATSVTVAAGAASATVSIPTQSVSGLAEDKSVVLTLISAQAGPVIVPVDTTAQTSTVTIKYNDDNGAKNPSPSIIQQDGGGCGSGGGIAVVVGALALLLAGTRRRHRH